MYLKCGTFSTPYCTIYFGTGGGLGFNFNIQLNNPSIDSASVIANLLALAESPILLANAAGITIKANPYANVAAQGLLNAEAVSSLTASFNTQAGFNMYAGLPDNPLGAGMTATVVLPQAQQQYSSYTKTNGLSVNFTLSTGIDWSIGYNVVGTGIDAIMNTEFQSYYGYGYGPTPAPASRRLGSGRRLQSSSCTSNSSMVMEPSFKGFTFNFFNNPIPIPAEASLGTISL
jgi:hypothetical protein